MTDALEVATEVADASLDVVDLFSTLEAAQRNDAWEAGRRRSSC
jgi:hypothetical protein